MITVLVLILGIFACGDLPVEPVEEGPAWCDAHAILIAGEWSRTLAQRRHEYSSTLLLEEVSPCLFNYYVDMVQVPHNGQPGMKVYQTNGQLLVTSYEATGPISRFAVDAHMDFQQTFGDHGATVISDGDAIYERDELTLWGDSIKLWGNTYERKD